MEAPCFCHLPGLKVEPEMISAVISWPAPDSGKQLQRFLGFANFDHYFVIADLRLCSGGGGDFQLPWSHGQSFLQVAPPPATLSERT